MANQTHRPYAVLRGLPQQDIALQMRMNPVWTAYPGYPVHLSQSGCSNQLIDPSYLEDVQLLKPVIAELHGSCGMWQTADAGMLAHTQYAMPYESLSFQDHYRFLQPEPLAYGPSANEPRAIEPPTIEPLAIEPHPLEPSELNLSELEPFELDSLDLDSLELDSRSLNIRQESSPQEHFPESLQLNEFMIKVTETLNR